jgi:adenosine deaminase
VEDPALIDEITERGITLEVCPTSNVLLHVVETIDAHPLPALRAAGVRVCINTDDPGWFATDVVTEMAIASEHLGVSRSDHLAMQLDAVSASFMSDTSRTKIAAEIKAFA